jgi:CheY-like chemotaxis protein
VQATNGGTEWARISPSPAAHRSVLVVEDNEPLRHTILDHAKSLGCEAWSASNGLEALWIVKHHRPALVLLDLTMPRLDGFETIRHIRKFDPAIEIVVVTGDASEATRRRVQDLGLELLIKPFDLRDLDALLEPR